MITTMREPAVRMGTSHTQVLLDQLRICQMTHPMWTVCLLAAKYLGHKSIGAYPREDGYLRDRLSSTEFAKGEYRVDHSQPRNLRS